MAIARRDNCGPDISLDPHSGQMIELFFVMIKI